MPDWLTNSYAVNILSGVAVVIIAAILAFFWNSIGMALRTKARASAESLDLHFDEFISFCGVQPKDGKWLGQIQTQWNVTNASKSGMPARLLTARLAKPRLPDARPVFEEAKGDVIMLEPNAQDIPPKRTGRISIHFFVVLPPSKLKSLTLHIVVIDQLSNEHPLDPITVKPQIAPPPTTDQT